MFEIESKNPDEISLTMKGGRTIRIDVARETIEADLEVGPLVGPGEFEIGDAAIRGIQAGEKQTIYDVNINNIHVGILGACEEATALDELGIADVLCTSSVRAVREIDPKIVVAMGNIDGMVTELKLSARTEKKLKLKNREGLPAALEVVVLA